MDKILFHKVRAGLSFLVVSFSIFAAWAHSMRYAFLLLIVHFFMIMIWKNSPPNKKKNCRNSNNFFFFVRNEQKKKKQKPKPQSPHTHTQKSKIISFLFALADYSNCSKCSNLKRNNSHNKSIHSKAANRLCNLNRNNNCSKPQTISIANWMVFWIWKHH